VTASDRINSVFQPLTDGAQSRFSLVVASHIGIALHSTLHIPYSDGIGQHGVAIFFVLSGFLITSRLQHEREARGSIDLRSFYIR
jgi:peptidoglycan/LPS O-acetylase OafA/YrhL